MAKCSSSITITIVNDGETGNGISSITYTYATSTTQTVPSTVDKTTIPTLSATNKYLWQKEVISYTDGTNKTTTALIGVYGDKGDTGAKGDKGDTGATGATGAKGDKGDTGATGATGATGNGISSIKYYYATSTTQSAPSSVTGTTIPTLSSANKYLWQKEVIAYTDGTNKTTTALIGVYGDKGDTGAKGDKGDKGDTGATGATGSKGDKGEKGDTGATGPQGPQGDKGDTGATGATGPQGEKGDKGDTGATGATGPQGPQGDKGDAAWSYVTLTSGYNLNNCFTKDTIYVSTSTAICNSLLNKPSGFVAGEVRVEVQWCGSDSYVIQKLYCKAGSTTKSFYRAKSGSTIGDWVEMGTKGDKGDTGATGATGPQGPQGEKGDKGDTGATGPQGPQGPQGNAGTPAYVWTFEASQKTYVRDPRSSANNTITLKSSVQGYSATPSWTTTGGTLSASSGSSVTLTVPYKNTVDTITITMSCSSPSLSCSMKISVVDMTVYGHSYGLLETAPTASSSPIPIYASGKPTDWYTNSVNGITYEYNGTSWVACTDASRLTGGLKLLIDNGTNLASISDSNTVSFFKTVLAQTIYAETIKAVEGFFNSIHVSGTSQFDGQIVNDALTTYAAQSGTRTITINGRNDALKNQSTGGTTSYYTASVKVSELDAAFGTYGTYVASAGTMTFVDSTGATVTYTASPANQITFIYQSNYLEVQMNGVSLVTYGDSIVWDNGGGAVTFVSGYGSGNLIAVSRVPRLYSDSTRYEGKINTTTLEIGGYAGYSEMTNIVPKATNTYYLGTSTKQWDVIYSRVINSQGTSNKVWGAVFN